MAATSSCGRFTWPSLPENDSERVVKLYEASLTALVRIRASPSPAQLVLDGLSFSETVRVSSFANAADSVFEFAVKLSSLDCVNIDLSGPKLVTHLKALGVNYRGKPIEKGMAYAIVAALPFAQSDRARGAVRFLESLAPTILLTLQS